MTQEELKEHLFCECDECIREYRWPLSNEMRPYYLKSEADKVIADLEESHKMEVEQLLMEIVGLKEAQRWRKFHDEKPTEDIKFLVINEKGFIQCCYYSPILKEFQIPVTHWMPLPSAPKEAK